MSNFKNKQKSARPVFFILRDIWKNLNQKKRLKVILVFFVMLLSSLAEVLSLSMVIPYLSFLEKGNLSENNFINQVINISGLKETNEIFFVLTLLLIIVVTFAAIIRLLNLSLNFKLSASIGSDISCDYFNKVIHQDYEEYIDNNSSAIINNSIEGTNSTFSFVIFTLQFLTSFLISISIFCALLLISWRIALFTFLIFGSSYLFLSIFTRKLISNNSKLITNSKEKQIKTVQESLGSMRDIIMDDQYGIYLNIYSKSDHLFRRKQAQNNFLAAFPRYALEAMGIVLIVLSAYLQASTFKSSNNLSLIPLLGTIAFASQRLLPSIQNSYSAVIGMRGVASQVEKVLKVLNNFEIHLKDTSFIKGYDFKQINLENLSFNYNGNKNKVLKNINLKISKGEVVGIIGITGSGKSTLLDIIMGLIRPSEGKIMLDEKNLYFSSEKDLIYKWRSIISHVPQDIFLKDESFYKNIAFGIPEESIDMVKVKKVAKSAKIDKFIKETKYGYHTKVGERGIQLSGGQKQRIGIARALYRNSKILILDEATSALDNDTENLIMNSINEIDPDITIIMVAHRLSSLKNCKRIIKIENGFKVQDGLREDIIKL